MSDDESDEKQLKIVVVGDGASGKTSICQRFARETFDRSYHQTLGLDFFSRRLVMPGDRQVLTQVWDIGGQSIAGEMIDKYIAGADAVLLVYDVTNLKSFDNVQDWLSVVKRICKGQEKQPQLTLVGNKTDLEEKRVITVEVHNTFANDHNLKPYYVSAKSGDSVVMLFRQSVAEILNIVLTKADVEADIVIVKGTLSEPTKPIIEPHPITAPKKTDQSKNTTVCSVS